MEANLDGAGVTTLATGVGADGVAVDGSHLYWADQNDGTIKEANLDGTGVTTLVTGQTYPAGVAVDGSHLYWTNAFGANQDIHNRNVMEANPDRTGLTTPGPGQT